MCMDNCGIVFFSIVSSYFADVLQLVQLSSFFMMLPL